jgi:hypothetical protein
MGNRECHVTVLRSFSSSVSGMKEEKEKLYIKMKAVFLHKFESRR